MISLMMCDDHTTTRDIIVNKLAKNPAFKILGVADGGQECIEKITMGMVPDVLILDISMPGMHGYEVAKWLQNNFPQIKVLVYSIIDDKLAVKAMIKFGVIGFVCKSPNLDELEQGIQLVGQGKCFYPEGFFFTASEIEEIKRSPLPWAEKISEKELLAANLIAQGLSRKQVASKMGIGFSALNKKLKRLFVKTHTDSGMRLIDFLKRLGIIEK